MPLDFEDGFNNYVIFTGQPSRKRHLSVSNSVFGHILKFSRSKNFWRQESLVWARIAEEASLMRD